MSGLEVLVDVCLLKAIQHAEQTKSVQASSVVRLWLRGLVLQDPVPAKVRVRLSLLDNTESNLHG